jgi:hypothetical protein
MSNALIALLVKKINDIQLKVNNIQLIKPKDGVNGKDGIDGKDGKDGKDGVDGKDGINGKDGIDGKDGKDGINGINGKDGKDGKDGIDGKDGLNGKDGIDGKDGKDGKNGRPPRHVVQGDTIAFEQPSGKLGKPIKIKSITNTYYGGGGDIRKWIDYAANYSSPPTLIDTIDAGDIYEYRYTDQTLYRLVPNDELLQDAFYKDYDNSVLSNLVAQRGM